LETRIQILVYIVEDDIFYTEILSDLLNDLTKKYKIRGVKIQLHSFYSSKETTFSLSKLKPDIVLLDYYILNDDLEPDTSYQIFRTIKQSDSPTDIIIVSGQLDEKIKHDLIAEGVTAYLTKNPEDLKELEKVLLSLIDKRIESNRNKKL